MQPGVQALAVAPDGTVSVVGRADGRGITTFRDGAMVGWVPLSQHHMAATPAVAVSSYFRWQAVRLPGKPGGEKSNSWGGHMGPPEGTIAYGILRCTPDGQPAPFAGGDGWFGCLRVVSDRGEIAGLAVDRQGRLFVSDPTADRIQVFDGASMREIGTIQAQRAGPLSVDGEGRLWMLRKACFAEEERAFRVNCGGEAVTGWERDRWRRGKVVVATAPIDVSEVRDPAPPEVYASSIHHSDSSTYWISGFIPTSACRVRIHLAEYQMPAGKRSMRLLVNGKVVADQLDVAAKAGGINKAMVVEAETRADERGTVRVEYRKLTGDGARLCGVEVIGRQRSERLAHPGEAVSFGSDLKPRAERIEFAQTERPESIACAPDGTVLIADSGPDNQVKAYQPGKTAPARSFGLRGGVFAPPVRGRAAPDRLTHPLAVACGPDGTVYVGDDSLPQDADIGGAALVAFAPEGAVRWRAEGYAFMDEPDWDRVTGELVYPSRRIAVDPTAAAGDQWRLVAVTADRFSFPWDARVGTGSALHRDAVWHVRLNEQQLMVLSSGGTYLMFRWDPARYGEIAIPCAAWSPNGVNRERFPASPEQGEWTWRDTNGDGIPQAGEYTPVISGTWGQGYSSPDAPGSWGATVDATGALWTTHGVRGIRRLPLAKKDGIPGWDPVAAQRWDAPPCFARGDLGRIAYDVVRDRLYLSGPSLQPGPYTIATQESPQGRLVGDLIARFDGWLAAKAPPAPAWTAAIPFDTTRLRSRHTARDMPAALTVEGDFVFVAYAAFGRIRAFSAEDGRFAGMMEVGPSLRSSALADDGTASGDVNALGLIDSGFAVRSWRRPGGEYLITYHDNFLNHTTLYRWDPKSDAPPASARLAVSQTPSDPATSLTAVWAAVPGATEYLVERSATAAGAHWQEAARVRQPQAVLKGLPSGGASFVRVRARREGGAWGDYSPVRWASTAGQPVISVNFSGGVTAMGDDEQAGLLPRLYWNGLTGDVSTKSVILRDDRGLATTTTVTWNGGRQIVHAGLPDQPGDRRMLRGQIQGDRINVTLAGIPYAHYDLLIYADQRGRHARMRVQAGGQTVILADGASDDFTGGWWSVPKDGHGNVAVLTGLSGAQLDVVLDGDPTVSACKDAVGVAFISGFQIVERK